MFRKCQNPKRCTTFENVFKKMGKKITQKKKIDKYFSLECSERLKENSII